MLYLPYILPPENAVLSVRITIFIILYFRTSGKNICSCIRTFVYGLHFWLDGFDANPSLKRKGIARLCSVQYFSF